MRGDGMTTFAPSLGSGSRWQSRRRLRQSQNIQCNSRSSTGAADVRESGASPTEYSLRFKSTGLWSSRASTAGATQGVGKRGNQGSCWAFSCTAPTLHCPTQPKLGLNGPLAARHGAPVRLHQNSSLQFRGPIRLCTKPSAFRSANDCNQAIAFLGRIVEQEQCSACCMANGRLAKLRR